MGAVYGYLRPKIAVKCAVLPYLDIQELKKVTMSSWLGYIKVYPNQLAVYIITKFRF